MFVPGIVENWILIVDAKDFQIQESKMQVLEYPLSQQIH